MHPDLIEHRLGKEIFTDISILNIRYEEQKKISPYASEYFSWDVYLDKENSRNSIAVTNDGCEAFELHCVPSSKKDAEDIIDNAIVEDYHADESEY
nr:hypothetical protein [Pantoea agglomerans]